jgi:glutamate synthase (NADPH) small chain
VHQGVPFIVQFSTLSAGEVPAVDPNGKRVVVVGGGDTAMDCLRTAVRAGAKEALCLYRRGEETMPATRKHYRNAVEEGAQFQFGVMPVADRRRYAHGQVRAVRCMRTECYEADGVQGVGPVAGSEFEVPADLVLVAFGFDRAPGLVGSDCATLARNRRR